MADLTTQLHRLSLRNPVMTASGTFGYGEEFTDFIDLNHLGAIIVKGTTATSREGNPYPRMAETASGMLNAVGLQNKGIDHFIHEIWPRLKQFKTPFIVNVSGSTIEEYIETAEKLDSLEGMPAIELNISCPNVKEGGMTFGTSCLAAASVTKAVRKVFH
ncbi:MAG: dihydroorotate dehydrogenase, partial [Bacteroidales bacterium]|nr:dihydroorotate dehydrogenase [Bacteroidales bacterium]